MSSAHYTVGQGAETEDYETVPSAANYDCVVEDWGKSPSGYLPVFADLYRRLDSLWLRTQNQLGHRLAAMSGSLNSRLRELQRAFQTHIQRRGTSALSYDESGESRYLEIGKHRWTRVKGKPKRRSQLRRDCSVNTVRLKNETEDSVVDKTNDPVENEETVVAPPAFNRSPTFKTNGLKLGYKDSLTNLRNISTYPKQVRKVLRRRSSSPRYRSLRRRRSSVRQSSVRQSSMRQSSVTCCCNHRHTRSCRRRRGMSGLSCNVCLLAGAGRKSGKSLVRALSSKKRKASSKTRSPRKLSLKRKSVHIINKRKRTKSQSLHRRKSKSSVISSKARRSTKPRLQRKKDMDRKSEISGSYHTSRYKFKNKLAAKKRDNVASRSRKNLPSARKRSESQKKPKLTTRKNKNAKKKRTEAKKETVTYVIVSKGTSRHACNASKTSDRHAVSANKSMRKVINRRNRKTGVSNIKKGHTHSTKSSPQKHKSKRKWVRRDLNASCKMALKGPRCTNHVTCEACDSICNDSFDNCINPYDLQSVPVLKISRTEGNMTLPIAVCSEPRENTPNRRKATRYVINRKYPQRSAKGGFGSINIKSPDRRCFRLPGGKRAKSAQRKMAKYIITSTGYSSLINKLRSRHQRRCSMCGHNSGIALPCGNFGYACTSTGRPLYQRRQTPSRCQTNSLSHLRDVLSAWNLATDDDYSVFQHGAASQPTPHRSFGCNQVHLANSCWDHRDDGRLLFPGADSTHSGLSERYRPQKIISGYTSRTSFRLRDSPPKLQAPKSQWHEFSERKPVKDLSDFHDWQMNSKTFRDRQTFSEYRDPADASFQRVRRVDSLELTRRRLAAQKPANISGDISSCSCSLTNSEQCFVHFGCDLSHPEEQDFFGSAPTINYLSSTSCVEIDTQSFISDDTPVGHGSFSSLVYDDMYRMRSRQSPVPIGGLSQPIIEDISQVYGFKQEEKGHRRQNHLLDEKVDTSPCVFRAVGFPINENFPKGSPSEEGHRTSLHDRGMADAQLFWSTAPLVPYAPFNKPMASRNNTDQLCSQQEDSHHVNRSTEGSTLAKLEMAYAAEKAKNFKTESKTDQSGLDAAFSLNRFSSVDNMLSGKQGEPRFSVSNCAQTYLNRLCDYRANGEAEVSDTNTHAAVIPALETDITKPVNERDKTGDTCETEAPEELGKKVFPSPIKLFPLTASPKGGNTKQLEHQEECTLYETKKFLDPTAKASNTMPVDKAIADQVQEENGIRKHEEISQGDQRQQLDVLEEENVTLHCNKYCDGEKLNSTFGLPTLVLRYQPPTSTDGGLRPQNSACANGANDCPSSTASKELVVDNLSGHLHAPFTSRDTSYDAFSSPPQTQKHTNSSGRSAIGSCQMEGIPQNPYLDVRSPGICTTWTCVVLDNTAIGPHSASGSSNARQQVTNFFRVTSPISQPSAPPMETCADSGHEESMEDLLDSRQYLARSSEVEMATDPSSGVVLKRSVSGNTLLYMNKDLNNHHECSKSMHGPFVEIEAKSLLVSKIDHLVFSSEDGAQKQQHIHSSADPTRALSPEHLNDRFPLFEACTIRTSQSDDVISTKSSTELNNKL
ncbi:hypothetical protein EGW08_013526 [Elysia chlorotica]|uniref:Uncharacterized protein n=1 Tax=Elysia chlorotica TaxID=188477 RepID=A0A433TAT6_ELYCH|nr:hypothetical protein EGW08_013526 [Elysia chlorotica]